LSNVESKITICGESFSPSDFQELDEIEQRIKMQEWFYENYEDPVERTPYESAEGGYIYIWGGPYDAHEELSVFYEFVSDSLIDDLASELSSECPEWTGKESPEDYDDSYFDSFISGNEYFESFKTSISHINVILQSEIKGDAQKHLLGLLYVNVITAIETYLSDAFISKVLEDKEILRKFVETNPEFKNQSFNLSDLFKKHDSIEQEVKSYLLGLMWHNIKKIKPMYKATLDVSFPADLSSIFKAIVNRHDLVHRGGKNKDGELVVITVELLNALISDAENFINPINEQIESVEIVDVCEIEF
jgi:hypothetical protein